MQISYNVCSDVCNLMSDKRISSCIINAFLFNYSLLIEVFYELAVKPDLQVQQFKLHIATIVNSISCCMDAIICIIGYSPQLCAIAQTIRISGAVLIATSNTYRKYTQVTDKLKSQIRK